MLPVIEMFTSVQGEGKFAGMPSFFMRVSGCNLRCVFKGSRCDTPYSSFDPEKSTYKNMKELVEAFLKMAVEHPNVYHLVITGGEPMLYKEQLKEFFSQVWNRLNDRDLFITIETNGTIEPFTEEEESQMGFNIDLYSVSPKLANSVGKAGDYGLAKAQIENHDKIRIQPSILLKYVLTGRYQFKFVYSDKAVVEEIDSLYSTLESLAMSMKESDHFLSPTYMSWTSQHPSNHTLLMPEGLTDEQLAVTRKECAEVCVEKGWMYTDRLHIVIWGNKRGV